ncbi:MAG: transcription antitermination factor NusB [Actinomycetes bacterium]
MAFEVLRAVHESGAYANLDLPDRLRARGVSGRDAAFATELTYGTLRFTGTYDVIATACIDRPWAQVDRPLQDLLRLGTHQLLGMDVPAHAAVAATVDLASAQVGRARAGFVNAVLRQISTRSYDDWVATLAADGGLSPTDILGLRYAHPDWLVNEFTRALVAKDRPAVEVSALLAADNERPKVTLASRPGLSSVEELLEAGGIPGRWSPFAAVWPSGDPGKIPAVREHRAGVQDEGSQLVAAALVSADIDSGAAPERWLDMCAGPGGKAALLAALGAAANASLEAWELLPHRARLVQQAVGPKVAVRTVDAADPARLLESEGVFDRVLLDAPCSGAGALRRRPEARWRKQPSDVAGLVTGQRRLLEGALRLVRPGGVVGYVTCSPLQAETSEVVASALKTHPGSLLIDAREQLPSGMPDLGSSFDVQLWPHLHHTDAMYLALIRRGAE